VVEYKRAVFADVFHSSGHYDSVIILTIVLHQQQNNILVERTVRYFSLKKKLFF